MTMPALEVEHAYRECERIARREAANFSYGIRLLPRPRRQAISAVYAFARRVDDIGDGALATEEKLAALSASGRAWRPWRATATGTVRSPWPWPTPGATTISRSRRSSC